MDYQIDSNAYMYRVTAVKTMVYSNDLPSQGDHVLTSHLSFNVT